MAVRTHETDVFTGPSHRGDTLGLTPHLWPGLHGSSPRTAAPETLSTDTSDYDRVPDWDAGSGRVKSGLGHSGPLSSSGTSAGGPWPVVSYSGGQSDLYNSFLVSVVGDEDSASASAAAGAGAVDDPSDVPAAAAEDLATPPAAEGLATPSVSAALCGRTRFTPQSRIT